MLKVEHLNPSARSGQGLNVSFDGAQGKPFDLIPFHTGWLLRRSKRFAYQVKQPPAV
jgi:hypothetical protein